MQSHQIPDDGDGSQNVGFFCVLDAADGPVEFY